MIALATRAVVALEQIAVELSKLTALLLQDAAIVARVRAALGEYPPAGRRER